MQVSCQIERLQSGGYMAHSDAMKPVVVQADTKDKVVEKFLSAARLYVQRHPEHKEEIASLDDGKIQ